MAVGTLLGVEFVRRHSEHVIALDADAMDEFGRLGAGRGGSFRLMRFVHDLILTASGAGESSPAFSDG